MPQSLSQNAIRCKGSTGRLKISRFFGRRCAVKDPNSVTYRLIGWGAAATSIEPGNEYSHAIPVDADDRLTPHQFRLLGHYIRTKDPSENLRATAQTTQMSIGMIVKVRSQLEELGYLQRIVNNTPEYVYLIKTNSGIHKIGMTTDTAKRITAFRGLPFQVEYVCIIQSNKARELESQLHQQFAQKRINGEWFNLSPEDVEHIKSLGVEA